MTRTADAFARGKAFIPFVTAGDPDLATTAKLVRAMAASGADLIEIGIPFSDPTAEGVTIQQANLRSLSVGTTTDGVFDLVRDLRQGKTGEPVTIPLAFMTYANVVFSYGSERFLSTCEEIGMNALILPDVPFEEKGEFDGVCKEHGIDLVSLIAPTSHERIKMIAREASGFVYCVSSLGVTGTRVHITTDIGAMVELVRAATDVPVAVGFGISNPAQAADMAAKSDGAIVGSAIVNIVAEKGRDAVEDVSAFVKEMADAVHQA
ncbi:MAG: tryptophan synthase subunit alpha [Coriobacteriales bacterium]|jgi:tryptophan synthase alpha chain